MPARAAGASVMVATRAGDLLLPAAGSGRIEEVITVTVRTLVSGLAVLSVAMLVPAGLAAERPDDRAGPIGVGGVAQAGGVQFEAYGTADTIVTRIEAGLDAHGNVIAATRPDDRADRFTPGMGEPAPVRPDDRADRVTPGSAAEPATATPTATTGIEWSDPLVIGALVALGAGMATALVFVVIHRRGGPPGTRGTHGRPAMTH